MLDGSLGNYTSDEYKIEFLKRAQPYHAFPVPKVHEETLKTEVDRLVNIGFLKNKNEFEWAASTFLIPKRNGTVHFISFLMLENLKKNQKELVPHS